MRRVAAPPGAQISGYDSAARGAASCVSYQLTLRDRRGVPAPDVDLPEKIERAV